VQTFDVDRLRAIVFDVDGTLYRQSPLRRTMFLRLLRMTVARPIAGLRTFRTLQAYRRAQEDLRNHVGGDIANAQLRLVGQRVGADREAVAACVTRWMEQEPLDVLRRCAHRGLDEFLRTCLARGLRLAALSDYPAEAKLRALGIGDCFELVLSAQSPEIDVFKPHPRGLQVAIDRLGVFRHECLYVGDRADVDAAAANAAGIACAILNPDGAPPSGQYETVTSFRQLQDRLFGSCHVPLRDVISSES
jgi:HAD superfamily hydrolase (TIGR01549 family)